MKRLFHIALAALVLTATGCQKLDDGSYALNDSHRRINALEEQCRRINSNIQALQTILKALQEEDFVTSITSIDENGSESGYRMSFLKSGEVSVYIIPDEDIPLLAISEGFWQASFDNGATWYQLIQAGKEDGHEPIFKDMGYDEANVYLTLADGTTLTVPLNLYASNEIVLSQNDLVNGSYFGNELTCPNPENMIRTGLISVKGGDVCVIDLSDGWSGHIGIHNSTSFITASDWGQKTEYRFPFDCNFCVSLKKNDDSSITPSDFDSTIRIHRTQAYKGGIPVEGHFKEEVIETIASVQKVLTEPYLMFAVVSDIHYMASAVLPNSIENTITNITALSTALGIDFMACLGDSVEGDTPSATTELYCDDILEQFARTGLPYYPCIGNHDDNRYRPPVFSHSQLRYNYLRNTTGVIGDYHTSMCGTNYYKDFEDLGIRCIFLNANTNGSYGYSSDTCDWFESAADSAPGQYIVFTHIAPVPALNYGFTQYGTDGGSTRIREKCLETSDKFIGMFCGHNHYDAFVTSPFLCISVNCQKFENENGDESLWAEGAVKPVRYIGDATEDCFDIVVVRPRSKKIDRIRFGAGEDQEYTIASEPDHTI